MRPFEVVLGAVMGLLIGSFLNVVIYRIPRGESIVSPPSACPNCGHRLSPWENIPVVSYVILGGRCHACKQRIPLRYPLVEILTALGFATVVYHFTDPILVVSYSVFAAWLVVLAFIDIDTRKLPRQLIYIAAMPSLILLGLSVVVRGDWGALSDMAIGAAIGVAILGAIHFVAPNSMGMGDVRFAGYVGLNLGYLTLYAVVDFLYGSFLLGAVFGVFYALLKHKSLKVAIPFGPFLSISAFGAMIIGNSLHIL